ncbi:hypothetical protein PH210_19190 [Paenibacillus sp. BSR1-1]|uniref:hypothetical protein n=1 Tax=Paenibacillus sp. BSR1-1 TaxID=3020845 RepID=UPI0025B1037B|nr:hypothetical protein [Paenibacillus sp. BSR1-1]MDN3018307.1 hypothetical protein [Paenibacillus sp. BSR1-1]
MEKTHETQSSEALKEINDNKLYTPIEELQKITAGGVYKRKSFKLSSMPKGIRYIGYAIIGFCILTFVIAIVLNLFY